MLQALIPVLSVLFFFLTLFIVWLILIKPNTKRRDRMKPFESVYIAHRGLFDNKGDAPENSMPAFKNAIQGGFGIELDVQITLDNKLVVFHDATLERMCGVDKAVEKCTYAELQEYCLLNSCEKIPLFEACLKEINGKVPLIIEIKPYDRWKNASQMTAEFLDDYNGDFCIESFSPFVLAWFKENRPQILRGQLSTDFFKDGIERRFFEKLILTNLMMNFKAKPDFIAYNFVHKNNLGYRLMRRAYRTINVAWTPRSQAELDSCQDVFTCFIFDSFIPKNKKNG